MRIYLAENVLEAARARVRWVYQEFDHVYVGTSGGKDSTVVLQLALEAAAELGRLPVPVVFIDQEAEWETVIDYMRTVMTDPRVSPRWLQVPIKLFNATSPEHPWLECWDPAEEAHWVRPKEPGAITKNVYGTDRFGKLFAAFIKYHHPGTHACYLSGVRAEESPNRRLALTLTEVYKGVTWGNVLDKRTLRHYTFYPIYDWSVTDVWKAIHDGGVSGTPWPYCRLYDLMFQHGVPVAEMRVSNLHHETAVRSLFYCQEVEAATWDRVQQRLYGIHTAGSLAADAFKVPAVVPPMFTDWRDYRDYLLEHLIEDPDQRIRFRQWFESYDRRFPAPELQDELGRTEVGTLLANDFHGTKLRSFGASHFMRSINLGAKTFGGAYGDRD